MRVRSKINRQFIYTKNKLFCFSFLQFFEKKVQFVRRIEPKTSAAGAAERGEVRTAAERLADLSGQRTDVGPLAAPDPDADAGQVVFHELHFVDVDERFAQFHLFARAGQLVGPDAFDLLGRIEGAGFAAVRR